MKSIKSITIILSLLFIANIIKGLFGLPIPDTIYALIIFLIFLILKIIKFETVEDTCETILAYMAMYFIPPATGLIKSYHMISDKIFRIIFIVIISTILTFLSTGFTVKYMMRRKK